MKKLNEKGFAISTILYGSLAVILILLMGIFSVIRTTKNMNDNFNEDIVKKLNECVTDEIILEQCYVAGGTCDTTSYYSCMGVTEDEIPNPATMSTIKDKLVASNGSLATGLHSDPYEPNRYIYRGPSANNYLTYAGYIWRILAIEADGSIKIIIDPSANDIITYWDDNNSPSNEWQGAALNNYINTTFYNAVITDTDKVIQKDWNVGTIYSEALEGVDSLVAGEKSSIYNGSNSTVGLITMSEYLRSSLTPACETDIYATCSSWLPKNMWTINGYVGSSTDKMASYVTSSGAISSAVVTRSDIKAYPVIFLKNTVKISSGDGSVGTPFILN